MLDTLAVGESLPLRLINLPEIKQLYNNLLKVTRTEVAQKYYSNKKNKNEPLKLFDAFSEKFPNKKSWDLFVNETVLFSNPDRQKGLFSPEIEILLSSVYPLIENIVFPVASSNALPLNYLAKILFREWRLYKILWLYHYIQKKEMGVGSEAIKCREAYGIKNWTLVFCQPILVNNQLNILIAGPIFQSELPLFSDEEYDDLIIKKTVNYLKPFAKQLQEFDYYKNRLHRAAHAVPFFPESRLNQRVERILLALSSILQVKIKHQYITTHQQISNLTLWALLGARHKNNLLKTSTGKSIYLYLQPDTYYNHSEYWLRMDIFSQINIQVDNESFYSLGDIAKDKRSFKEYGFLIKADHLSKEGYENLCIAFIELLSSYTNKNKLIAQKHYLLFSEWLQSKAGTLLTPDQDPANNPSLLDKSARQISRWISDLLRADFCILYQFETRDLSEGVLKAYNCYFSNPKNEFLEVILKNDLNDIATDTIKRKQSISYRAIDTGEQKICYHFSNDSEIQTIPENETLYHSQQAIDKTGGKAPFASALSTPIRFSGRRLGVIELSGKQAWQFRYAHKIPLQQIAAQLSPFLYQHRFMEAMHSIQQSMLEFHAEKIDEKTLYDKLCKSISHLFLCSGCSLWVRDEVETHMLKRKGTHHFDLPVGEVYLNTKGSFIAKSIKSIEKEGKIYHFSLETNKYQGEEVNWPSMRDQGIELMTILPIIEATNKTNSGVKVTATINLYNRNTIDYDDSWQGTIEFMSRYLSFVIDATKAFINERGFLANVYTHEIWHDAAYIADKTRKLYSDRQYLKKDIEKLRRFVTSNWFQQRLPAASISGQLNDKEFILRLQQQLDSNWFLPAEDILFFSDMLHTRVQHLFGKDSNLRKNNKNLVIQMGDIPEDIRELVFCSEKERLIPLRSLLNSLIEGDNYLRSKGLYISKNIAPYGVRTLPSLMKEVLRNLINNALKYSVANKSIDIELRYKQFNGSLVFSIKNYASRLKYKGEIRRILQKGVRGSNSYESDNSSDVPGKGIGLYTVDKVCKHILRIDFSFQEVPEENGISLFVAEIIIPPSKVERV